MSISEHKVTKATTENPNTSLASLNQLAAASAMRLIEDLVAERIQNSIWLQLEFDRSGRMQTSYLPQENTNLNTSRECPLCSRLMGCGDDGLHTAHQLIKVPEEWQDDL